QFKEIFWEETVKCWGFAFSDQSIPTWWTQEPQKKPLLTGWLGGPLSWEMLNEPEEKLIQMGIDSVAGMLNKSPQYIKEYLENAYAWNWAANPFIAGSYSYPLVGTNVARKTLNTPVENTLFFAGEALHEGSSQGTVEAALSSGLKAARMVLVA